LRIFRAEGKKESELQKGKIQKSIPIEIEIRLK
jgi:hypothetical protein